MQMSAQELRSKLLVMCVRNKIIKVRVYEKAMSYEDFSISYTLQGVPVMNFTVEEDNEFIYLKKKDKRSSKHVMFKKDIEIDLSISENKKPHMRLNILGEVRYIDGSHRYIKETK